MKRKMKKIGRVLFVKVGDRRLGCPPSRRQLQQVKDELDTASMRDSLRVDKVIVTSPFVDVKIVRRLV